MAEAKRTGSHPVLCGSIAGRPGRFGVAMHTAGYRHLGLDWTYVAFGTEDTAGAVAAMRSLGLRGLGVTMPHKEAILPLLDRVEETARAIGAVNTVVNDSGVLTGHNTDWVGFLRAVAEAGPIAAAGLAGRRAAVIGAGGGARAMLYALRREGCAATVFNRGAGRGRALAAEFDAAFGGPPAALAGAGRFDLLVHATPVGFHAAEDMLVPAAALRSGGEHGLTVFDAVPMPVETRLIREARAAGCAVVPGIRMQIHQALWQFELYTGRQVGFAVMEQALLRVLDEIAAASRSS